MMVLEIENVICFKNKLTLSTRKFTKKLFKFYVEKIQGVKIKTETWKRLSNNNKRG